MTIYLRAARGRACVYDMVYKYIMLCVHTPAGYIGGRCGSGEMRRVGGLKVLSKSRVRLGFLAPYPGAINSGFPVRIFPGTLRRDSNNNFQLTKTRRYRRRCTIRTGHYYYYIIIALCYYPSRTLKKNVSRYSTVILFYHCGSYTTNNIIITKISYSSNVVIGCVPLLPHHFASIRFL